MNTIAHQGCLEFFNSKFADAARTEFNPKWANSTGYMDGIPGDIMVRQNLSFVDPHGRKGVIMPMPDRTGNLCIFQRFSDGTGPLIIQFVEGFDKEDNCVIPGSAVFKLEANQDELVSQLVTQLTWGSV